MKKMNLNDSLNEVIDALNTADPVILAPTETVYGLLCAWSNQTAREKIYTLKQRPANKQLAAFLPDVDSVLNLIPALPRNARILAERFCPGPITLVVPDGQGGTFGFRIPDHPWILRLLKEYGKPLASTSANLSGTPAALSVEEAMATLAGEPEFLVDGGAIDRNSRASTVVMVQADGDWKILRGGPISEEMIRDTLSAAE